MVRRGRPIGGAVAFDRDMDDFGDRENADLRRQVEYLTRQVAKLTTDKRNVEVESDDNPFGEDPDQGVQHDRRWEIGFRVDVPDFDGSLRADEDDNTVSPFGEDPERGVYQDRRWELGFRVDIPDFDGGLRAEEWHYETMDDEPIFDEYPEEEILDGDGHENLVIRKTLFIEDNEVEEDSKGLEYGEPKYDEYADDDVLCGLTANSPAQAPEGSAVLVVLKEARIEAMAFETQLGLGNYGQLGHVDFEDHPIPHKLEALYEYFITEISGGGRHTMALASIGKLFGWGWNKFGQAGSYDKLKDREVGPCKVEVVQMINDNVYRVRLPSPLKTSDVFNGEHLTRYVGEFGARRVDSRASPFQPGEYDAGASRRSRGPLRGPVNSVDVRV